MTEQTENTEIDALVGELQNSTDWAVRNYAAESLGNQGVKTEEVIGALKRPRNLTRIIQFEKQLVIPS